MFHNKRILSASALVTAIFAALFLTFAAPTARAAVVPGADLSTGVSKTVSASLAQITGKDELILDHLTGKAEFTFDIPAGDYAEDLRLKIRALPQGDVDRNAKIMVRFNSGKPVPVSSRGNGFSAEIKLSGGRVRSQSNVITLTYTGANAAVCTGTDHGKWVIDLKSSRLSADVRSKKAGYQIAHIEPRLAHPMTAPRSVAIIAKGSDKTGLEALTAQAIGLRVQDIPTFKLRDSAADLKIYVGTRSQLGRIIKDVDIAADKRPVIGVQTVARKPQLIITSDTQGELKALVQSFAHAHLPRSRRARVSLSEIKVQMPFSYETVKPVRGKTSWSNLGAGNFAYGLNPSPMQANFKVSNAQMSTGELRLGLSKSVDIADTSRVAVSLNGKPLGFTKMDKLSKTVAFPFPAGSLMSGNNEITVTPALSGTQNCTSAGLPPSLLISAKTALIIESPKNSVIDLGSFAAGGTPFSGASGALTDVYLTGSEYNRASALKILAKAAQTSGEGWTAARFSAKSPQNLDAQRHAFIIGPLPVSKAGVLSGAPRAFRNAMRGQVSPGVVKTASNDGTSAFALAANQNSRTKSVASGGIATIFAAQNTGTVVGVISTPRSGNFSKLAGALVQEPNWSNLSGSVASWDRKGVTLLQAADTNITVKPAKIASPGGDLAGAVKAFNVAVKDRFSGGLDFLASLKPSKAAPVQAAKVAAPAITAPAAITVAAPKTIAKPVTVTPAVLRGRSDLKATSHINSAPAQDFSLQSVLDWSGFDAQYFKTNVAHKTKALLGKLPASGENAKPEIKALLSGDLKSKGLLIFLVSVMALMLIGLAAPSSSNKNIG